MDKKNLLIFSCLVSLSAQANAEIFSIEFKELQSATSISAGKDSVEKSDAISGKKVVGQKDLKKQEQNEKINPRKNKKKSESKKDRSEELNGKGVDVNKNQNATFVSFPIAFEEKKDSKESSYSPVDSDSVSVVKESGAVGTNDKVAAKHDNASLHSFPIAFSQKKEEKDSSEIGDTSQLITPVKDVNPIKTNDNSGDNNKNIVLQSFPIAFGTRKESVEEVVEDTTLPNRDPLPDSPPPIVSGKKVSKSDNKAKNVVDSSTKSVVVDFKKDPVNTNLLNRKNVVNSQSASQKSNGQVLKDIVKLALEWHPLIKRSASDLKYSEQVVKEARSQYFPTVTAQVKSGYDKDSVGENRAYSNLIVQLNQTVFDFGRTSNKVKYAHTVVEKNEYGLEKSKNAIAADASEAFLQVLRYKKLAVVASAQVTGLKKITQIAQDRAELGAGNRSELSQAIVRLTTAESTEQDIQAQLQRWSATLITLTNQDVASNLSEVGLDKLEKVFSQVDMESLASPQIKEAQAQVKMAESQLSMAKSEYYPSIQLAPAYQYRLKDDSSTVTSADKKDNYGVYLNVVIPLYQGGLTTAKVNEARQALTSAEYNADTELVNAKQAVFEAISQYPGLKRSLLSKEEKAKHTENTRDLYKMQYIELGTRSFIDLLNAESEIHQTEMEIINGVYTIRRLAIDVLYKSGALYSKLNELM